MERGGPIEDHNVEIQIRGLRFDLAADQVGRWQAVDQCQVASAKAPLAEVSREIDGIEQPGPAPRFSRTPSEIAHGPEDPGANQREALSAWGLSDEEIRVLI